MKSNAKKWLYGSAAALGAMTALVGFMHTSVGRPLLMKLGGCPVGHASAAEVEQARVDATRILRGDKPAPARPALGFTLESSTTTDVHAWASRVSVSCDDRREGMLIVCKDLPAGALAGHDALDEVAFAFRPSDKRLVNITANSFALSNEEAAARMNKAAGVLQGQLGAPTKAAGDATAERFARGGYATAIVSYAYSDYVAEVSATSFGKRGVSVREHYVSAND